MIKTKKIYEKSVVTKKNIEKNEKFNIKNITTKKPGTGISAKYYFKILNKKSRSSIKKNSILKWNQII